MDFTQYVTKIVTPFTGCILSSFDLHKNCDANARKLCGAFIFFATA